MCGRVSRGTRPRRERADDHHGHGQASPYSIQLIVILVPRPPGCTNKHSGGFVERCEYGLQLLVRWRRRLRKGRCVRVPNNSVQFIAQFVQSNTRRFSAIWVLGKFGVKSAVNELILEAEWCVRTPRHPPRSAVTSVDEVLV